MVALGQFSSRDNIAKLGVMAALCCLSNASLAEEAQPSPASQRADAIELRAKKPVRGIDKLDKKSKVKVLAALAAFLILAFGMIALTWLGARVTKRYMNPAPFDHQRKKSSAPLPDDWAAKPLVDHSEFTKEP